MFLDLNIELSSVWALVAGCGLGFIVGLIPGIGQRTGLLLAIPLATAFDPYSAAIFLFAMHAVVHTSSSIPAIALGMPISGADAATVVDGYPLTKMGRGGEALGASLSASAIGGVLGALAFLAAIPIARPLVTTFGPPEMLILALLGMTLVIALSNEGLLQGLVVGLIGILFAMVGLDGRTGESRFTFGLIELWDGLSLPALICGLYVIPEMLTTTRYDDAKSYDRALNTSIRDVWRGMYLTFRYKAVLIRSSLYGVLVGLTPSVGATVGVWMAYSYAARTTKSEIPFGKGAIAGVIAPEAANNSKEGGAMIPTLLLGIPGSSTMAIMIGALGFIGVAVGPNLLGKDVSLSYSLGMTVVLANVLAILPFFLIVPFVVRLSAIKREAVSPVAITMSFTAALITAPTISTVFQVFVATLLGVSLMRANWPRAPFILGFAVSHMAEKSYFLTAEIWGWRTFERPQFILLLLALVGWLGFSLLRRPSQFAAAPKTATLTLCAILMAAFGIVFTLSLALPRSLGLMPLASAAFALVLCGLIAVLALKSQEPQEPGEKIENLDLAGMLVLATPIIGLSAATIAFATAFLRRNNIRWIHTFLIAMGLCAVQLAFVTAVFDVLVEKEFIGRILWKILGY